MKLAHMLSGRELKRDYLQAVQQDKELVYLVHFLDAGVTAEVRVTMEKPDQWHGSH